MNEAPIKLEPVVSLRTGKVVAYEVLYRGFNREAEKAFASIDEEWDYEIFLSNVLTLRHMLENGVLPEPHRFLLNQAFHSSCFCRLYYEPYRDATFCGNLRAS